MEKKHVKIKRKMLISLDLSDYDIKTLCKLHSRAYEVEENAISPLAVSFDHLNTLGLANRTFAQTESDGTTWYRVSINLFGEYIATQYKSLDV